MTINPQRNLPDMILVDLGPVEPLLVFVEVVATSGPVSASRQAALWKIAKEAGFNKKQVVFVTAFEDRDTTAFKNAMSQLAWRSFAWFMSEPDHILILHQGVHDEPVKLTSLNAIH